MPFVADNNTAKPRIYIYVYGAIHTQHRRRTNTTNRIELEHALWTNNNNKSIEERKNIKATQRIQRDTQQLTFIWKSVLLFCPFFKYLANDSAFKILFSNVKNFQKIE